MADQAEEEGGSWQDPPPIPALGKPLAPLPRPELGWVGKSHKFPGRKGRGLSLLSPPPSLLQAGLLCFSCSILPAGGGLQGLWCRGGRRGGSAGWEEEATAARASSPAQATRVGGLPPQKQSRGWGRCPPTPEERLRRWSGEGRFPLSSRPGGDPGCIRVAGRVEGGGGGGKEPMGLCRIPEGRGPLSGKRGGVGDGISPPDVFLSTRLGVDSRTREKGGQETGRGLWAFAPCCPPGAGSLGGLTPHVSRGPGFGGANTPLSPSVPCSGFGALPLVPDPVEGTWGGPPAPPLLGPRPPSASRADGGQEGPCSPGFMLSPQP